MLRLGLGTCESKRRTQAALDLAWAYVGEFFVVDELESGLVAAGTAVDRRLLENPWRDAVSRTMAAADLDLAHASLVPAGRSSRAAHRALRAYVGPDAVSATRVSRVDVVMQVIPLVPQERQVLKQRRARSRWPHLFDLLDSVMDPEIPVAQYLGPGHLAGRAG